MLEYLAGQFQLRSTRGREETACAGSIRGFATLGPSPSLNCSSASAQQMEGGPCLRVAVNRPASSHAFQFDLQPTFLAPRYLSVICSVPGGCLVLSSCGTIAQPERTGQTHPSEVVWPITSWRIRERLLWASQPGERWRRVHCVQRRHGSCRVRSILDRTVLEMLA
ncbi:uncharacterized protein LOC120869215 isoform X3 [Oryx dammah]|uniref:uncharacterized protein LOC120869215 isoform X3 n=1 Tax=Oryx dammah TaxID=59534 RepID=UPI001A9C178C|nr:uncharacterized protein LOC120869215 isoform X3 [Oryx dammah]